ncbi:transcriptional regulator with XRE-family HTH domain [Rhodobacteraceae bacterium MBR-64]|jgi:transcriptional regulator with XRE-family HTH domain
MAETTDENWYGEDAATFGDRLAAAREAAGMSQADLARRLGVKLITITGWEDDRLEPRANRLQMVAGLLNVSMVWLLTGKGEGVPAPDEGGQITPDVSAIFAEMRQLRADIGTSAERLGLLEKRLRRALGAVT